MDKKSKEALRRYKKSRQQASSSDSSSSDSDSSSSYSSSDSERERHRKKKSMRRDTSSEDERRKREKREHCQKKLERKKDHLKRKLKAAKLKKRAAAAAAALSSHSYRALSPATQAKLKKIAERDKLRAASKEHREREKHRAREREREREHHRGGSRSPTKITKIRIHQDVKRQKSPPRMHHQLMSREKIIIQARTRDRTPSAEREARQRHEHKLRHEEMVRERERRERDRERAEREAAREKERAEALARCQERQRERERLAREKLRREEEEKKYASGVGGSVVGGGNSSSERLLPRPSERELAMSRAYSSRERSLEAVERSRHLSKRDLDLYERGEPDYLEAERRGLLDREEMRRDHRDYIPSRRRELSPLPEQYGGRIRDPRDLYPEEERERPFKRSYVDDPRDRDAWLEQRDLRERGSELHKPRDYNMDMEPELMYADERERLVRERERKLSGRAEWKDDWQMQREHDWDDAGPPGRSGFVGGPKRGAHSLAASKLVAREKRPPSEPDWDTGDAKDGPTTSKPPIAESQRDWIEHDQREVLDAHSKPSGGPHGWQMDWRDGEEANFIRGPMPPHMHMHHRGERGGRGGFRRGAMMEHGERNPQGGGFRPHPPPLMNIPLHPPGGGFHGNPRFPHKRPMIFNNPNVMIRKQQAVLAAAKAAAQASAVAAATTAVAAAKAAAQSAANATTNPGILGQVSGTRPASATDDKPEAGEILSTKVEAEKPATTLTTATPAIGTPATSIAVLEADKASGELSEISDSEDDILNRNEKKPKTDTEAGEMDTDEVVADVSSPAVAVSTTVAAAPAEIEATAAETNKPPVVAAVVPATVEQPPVAAVVEKEEDDEMPDFEEISDGELEEEARHKGVGDALGVDWASLIAETKRQAEDIVPNPNDQTTTAKQRWQPHRVILDIGISMRMAGEEYAKRLLAEAKQKLDSEMEQLIDTKAIKAEIVEEENEEKNVEPMQTNDDNVESKEPVESVVKPDEEAASANNNTTEEGYAINVDKLHPLACIQVAERRRQWSQQNLIANACGPNSRALSARQDLKLRRQLCGLPAREINMPRPMPATSQKLKSMALAAFQRACEVK